MSEGKIGRILGLISAKKQLILLPAALIIGVILLIIGGRGDASAVSGKVSEENTSTTSECERRLEEKVRLICEKVSGVSDVSAMVTVETVFENIFAENVQIKISENSQETRKEFAGSSESPIRIGERGARVRGVAVVCRGGDDPSIKLALTEMLSAVFGIPTSSVSVIGGG